MCDYIFNMNNVDVDINIGDLVRLKGFKLQKASEVPYGLVEKISYKYCNVQWLNKSIADRFALNKVIEKIKLEIIHKASQNPKKV